MNASWNALLIAATLCATSIQLCIAAPSPPKKNSAGTIELKMESPSLAPPPLLQGSVQQKVAGDESIFSEPADPELKRISAMTDKNKLFEMASSFSKSNETEKAERSLYRITILDPENGNAFKQLGRLEAAHGQVYDAVANLWIARELAATDDSDRRLITSLQQQLVDLSARNGARYHDYENYAQAGNVNSLLNQGVRFYSIGDHRNAWRLFAEAARQAPKDPDAFFNLGALCENAGLMDEAKNFYLRACRTDPTDFQSRLALGDLGKGHFAFQGSKTDLSARAQSVCPICRISKGVLMQGD